jgi:hypothetical protein
MTLTSSRSGEVTEKSCVAQRLPGGATATQVERLTVVPPASTETDT